jgi:uncharacterized LabA/DUF88 family protein
MQRALYAIMVDGGFITKKLLQSNGRAATANDVEAECTRLRGLAHVADYELLRIYFYDAPPSVASLRLPVSGGAHHLGRTPRATQAQSLYDQLVLRPNFALRMGETSLKPHGWRLKPRVTRQLVRVPRALTDADFDLDIEQKGVDLRIGLDMARLALREMVRAIVVVTADSDFVPAFKFVRREGVKIILDTMGHTTKPELKAHADIVV